MRSSATGYEFRQIESADDLAYEGFSALFYDAFAGPPYFEKTPAAIIREIWEVHIPYYCGIAVHETDGVVGLACAAPALADIHPDVRSFLMAQKDPPFPPDEAIYHSEVAVRAEHRRHGLGRKLILLRLEWARQNGFRYFVMRTAQSGSNSERLYRRLGAEQAPFVQDVTDVGSSGVVSSSTHRIYLWGRTEIPDQI